VSYSIAGRLLFFIQSKGRIFSSQFATKNGFVRWGKIKCEATEGLAFLCGGVASLFILRSDSQTALPKSSELSVSVSDTVHSER